MKKLLVVDDSPEYVDIITRTLKSEFEIISASDGEKALEMEQNRKEVELFKTENKI